MCVLLCGLYASCLACALRGELDIFTDEETGCEGRHWACCTLETNVIGTSRLFRRRPMNRVVVPWVRRRKRRRREESPHVANGHHAMEMRDFPA